MTEQGSEREQLCETHFNVEAPCCPVCLLNELDRLKATLQEISENEALFEYGHPSTTKKAQEALKFGTEGGTTRQGTAQAASVGSADDGASSQLEVGAETLRDRIEELEGVLRGVRPLVATSRCLRRPKQKDQPDPGPCGKCAPCLARRALDDLTASEASPREERCPPGCAKCADEYLAAKERPAPATQQKEERGT